MTMSRTNRPRFEKARKIFARGTQVRTNRFSLRLTVEGVMLLIVILLVGFAAWHSGTNLLYLIFSILVALYLGHGFILSINMSGLVIDTKVPDVVVANQPFDVMATVKNKKWFSPSYALRIGHKIDNQSRVIGAVFFPIIPRSASLDGSYTATVRRRGRHVLSAASIATRYPFGFEERSQTRTVKSEILALPPTYSVNAVAANIPFGFGDQESTVKGSGTELYGLREYVPGEHARHVHWKTSARTQKIMLAEYTKDERRQVILQLDNGIANEWRDAASEEFENAVVLAASLARHLIDSGFEVGLVTTDKILPVGQGPAHIMTILRHLALIELTSPRKLPHVNGTLMRIAYHSQEDESPNQKDLVVDSRNWTPQRDQFIHGTYVL